MKARNVIISVLCAVALVACETWEPNFPEGDYSLREQIEGQWFAQAYISPYGRQVSILDYDYNIIPMTFSFGDYDTCYIRWHCVVNMFYLVNTIDDKNHITMLYGGCLTQGLDLSGKSDKFFRVMESVNSGYVREDTLFLLTDPKKNHQYKAICLTR